MRKPFACVPLTLVAISLYASDAQAHCDGMDGPVINDAQRALASKDVFPVLKWVPEQDAEQIQAVFETTLAVRGQSEDARGVADSHFFETLVRIHRAGEGEGFTGLKPAGSADPAFVATDRALAGGDIGPLGEEMAAAVRDAIEQRFAAAYEKRQVAEESVQQGREYVEAYVQLTHFVEAVEHLIAQGASPKHRQDEELKGQLK
jgi:Family of unknown function (DUF6448)